MVIMYLLQPPIDKKISIYLLIVSLKVRKYRIIYGKKRPYLGKKIFPTKKI